MREALCSPQRSCSLWGQLHGLSHNRASNGAQPLTCIRTSCLCVPQTEMVDMLSADPQEVVAAVGRSKGIVLMSPPASSSEAKTNLAAMTSALKSGTKVSLLYSLGMGGGPFCGTCQV